MLISMRNPFSKEINTLDINITKEQYNRFIEGKENIQTIMPKISADEREFLITGMLPGEFDQLFSDDDE